MRWVAPAVYVAALSAYMWREGIPVGRERLLLWIVLGLLALSTANGVAWTRSVVLEWLPFALVLAAYDLLRGQADGLLFSAWYRPQLEADAFLGGGTVPTVWLQEQLWHGSSDVRWYDYASWAVYVSFFLATYVVAGLLWFVSRSQFRRYVGSVALLAGMGFATFALFPAAPPWLASREGELEWTTRLIGQISGHIPFIAFSFEGLWERGSEYSNPVAAVPSLHAAYTLLITLFLWRLAPWVWARVLLVLYPLAMAFALVYTAEHYLVDILLGWAYTLVAVWVVIESPQWEHAAHTTALESFRTLSDNFGMAAGPAAVRVELMYDADEGRVDELTAALRRELLALDVERVERETSQAPAGSKGLELGALLVTLGQTAGALSGLVSGLRAWAGRGGRHLKLEVDGDSIEISGATSEQQEQLIAAWIARQERR